VSYIGLMAVFAGVFGLCVGSFLTVVAARAPEDESIVAPRSRCPACGTTITARDNIPVLSWLLLRGKCRTCGRPIAKRYPLTEAVTAALFVTVTVRFEAGVAAIPFAVFVASLVALSVIDFERFILPRKIIYTAAAISAPLLVAAALVRDEPDRMWRAAAGAAVGFGILFVIHLISPKGMGFGDVRLAGLIGLHLGWLGLGYVFVGLFFGFLLASVVGIALMALGRRSRKDRIPFGPFLAGGAVIAVLFGAPVLRAYLGA
jgi:leader peptidase (prepilin peptidase) / N-methyltransferase